MHVQYSLAFTHGDYIDAERLRRGKVGWWFYAALFGGFLWTLAAPTSEQHSYSLAEAVNLATLLTAVFWVMMKFNEFSTPWVQHRVWARNGKLPVGQVDVVLNESGIAQTNSQWQTWDSWSRFERVLEDRQLFFAVRKEGVGCIIPKRALSAEQINAVRAGLRRVLA